MPTDQPLQDLQTVMTVSPVCNLCLNLASNYVLGSSKKGTLKIVLCGPSQYFLGVCLPIEPPADAAPYMRKYPCRVRCCCCYCCSRGRPIAIGSACRRAAQDQMHFLMLPWHVRACVHPEAGHSSCVHRRAACCGPRIRCGVSLWLQWNC